MLKMLIKKDTSKLLHTETASSPLHSSVHSKMSKKQPQSIPYYPKLTGRPQFQPWFLEETEIISIIPNSGWTFPISTKLRLAGMATAASSSSSSSSTAFFPSPSSSIGLSSFPHGWIHVLLLRKGKKTVLSNEDDLAHCKCLGTHHLFFHVTRENTLSNHSIITCMLYLYAPEAKHIILEHC